MAPGQTPLGSVDPPSLTSLPACSTIPEAGSVTEWGALRACVLWDFESCSGVLISVVVKGYDIRRI